MSLPKYPHYKPSGVQWLGEVPAHWELKRLRRCLQLNPSKSEIACESRNKEVSFLPMEAIGDDGRLDLSRTRPVNEVETGYTYFRDGDVTLAKITPCFENGKGALMTGLVGGFGFGTTELIVARPAPGRLSSEFLNWLFCSPNFRREGEACMYGAGGQKRVPDDFVRTLVWAVPPVGEQTAIAHFLDHETAKIDALIAEQEKLIHLLAEKRQATISHAVTRGLDPAAPMKDSGVAWLGEVPAHWTVCPIKLVARIGNGSTPNRDNPDYWAEEGFPWLNSSVVNQDEVSEAERFVTELALAECHLPVIEPPAILVGITGQGKTRGMATRLAFKATVNQHLAYIKPTLGRIDEKFLLRIFEAVYLHLRTESEGAGSTKGAITCEQLGNLRIPVPNLAEQIEIAAKIETETTRLDALRAEAERAIALLKERRAAFIAAAVTGQIDVRQNSEILNGGEARDAVAALS